MFAHWLDNTALSEHWPEILANFYIILAHVPEVCEGKDIQSPAAV